MFRQSSVNVALRIGLMKYHLAINVAARVFKLNRDTIWTNAKFQEDWAINMISRVFFKLTNFMLGREIIGTNVLTKKNAPPTDGHVFQATGTTFELVQNIIGTNLLTKFHDDRTINMASRVLTRKNATPPWRPYII
ncbi:hypothetical protein DPMN_014319 [Dreissena polymorpha]|uniref:Uncharacterized protein n=1 Tax=Dreissena polymorpha TaxID=45954 RepID=A0A9D4N9E3_DREPO|nr:hypothetical protein DPMN_014319 [Dreissena polymorpha]